MPRTRRSLLRAGGVAGLLAVAGCGSRRDSTIREGRDTGSAAPSTSTPEATLGRASLPEGALWMPPSLDPPGFAPGRFVRQVSVGSITATKSAMHPSVYDDYATELWEQPERLFGVSAADVEAKYQLPGGRVRVLSGSFDPEAVGEYLGRPFERSGTRNGLTLYVRQLQRGERLVAVNEDFLVAGGRDSAMSAIQARFGALDPLPIVDERVGQAAVAVDETDVFTINDRYNVGRRGLLADVAARGVAWTFESARTRLTAPFVFYTEAATDTAVVDEWTREFRGLETYENVSLSRDGRVVTVDGTTDTALFDGGVSGRPGE